MVLKNCELVPAIKFLNGMELRASDSRHRTKVLNLLNEAAKGLGESEIALVKEYAMLDANGDPIVSEQGNITLKQGKVSDYHTEHARLLDEEVAISGGIHAENIRAFGNVLKEYDGVISGDMANIYDRLMEEYEKEGQS